ncbi:MAG: rRNA maturation RNase YbeY [Firmicutes bacterium]|nr:rRNA maturation RNase YbeY [Bacillota bacterium]MBQ6013470.1 rRNA maturation RNase YbeY [Bacillota bacterium]MBR0441084.1 rRNA maturation RNase YbeY [Bacillota bacterium]MBR0521678.1 rRNA maturation RNase YbeY [Bacillota bacterium]
MTIYFDEERRPGEETEELMNRAAMLCLENEEMETEDVSLSVTIVGKDEIRVLNRDYRNVDSVTDVLSFPAYGDEEEISLEEGEELSLGDVVICEERAREQAEEYGHSFDRELIYLFTHSVLHLLGYDHMTDEDKAVMREKEEAVMSALGLTRGEN